MKSVVVLRHVHFEDLGTFAQVLERHGYTIVYHEVGQGSFPHTAAQSAELLIVLGGPIGAYEETLYPFLLDEMSALAHRFERRLPILGICLGAQLIARSMGAAVYPGPAKEIGWAAVQLTPEGRAGWLQSLQETPVLHWHGDTFDLPEGAVRLASTAVCVNQAFSVDHHVLAFQFHPEVMGDTFERWLIGHACEISATPGITVPGLRAQTATFSEAAAEAGTQCFDRWLSQLNVADMR